MNEPVEPIRPAPLPEALAGRIRKLIVEGELKPGAKVNEQALCERFGVSRTPLREALRALAAEGLITLTPRRGAAVSELTIADLEQAFPILGALEALAGELACANISDAEIARAHALQEAMRASRREQDLQRYRAVNAEIHALILEAADNATLAQMLRSLDARVNRARHMVNIAPARWTAAVEEHEEILAALAARDGARLGALLKNHIANKLVSLREQLLAQGVAEAS